MIYNHKTVNQRSTDNGQKVKEWYIKHYSGNTLLMKKDRQCNGQKTMIYKTLLRTLVSSNFQWRRTDNAMVKRQWSTKHYSEDWCLQNFSEEGQTMQWPKDNDLQNTNVALIITTKISSKCSIFFSFSFQVLYAKMCVFLYC